MRDQTAVVKERQEIARGIVALDLRLEHWEDVVPGQFVHVAVNGSYLRRPISIAEADPVEKSLLLIVQKIGAGTALLADASRQGTSLKILSPLGRGFVWEKEKSVWLVGGGVGVAPLILLARRLYEDGGKVESFTGFRDEDRVYGLERLQKYGKVHSSVGGIVTEALEERLLRERPDLLLTCGPAPMLKAVQSLCRRHGLRAQASLEEYMGCGIGACLVCNCKIRVKDGFAYKRVCADGPVFDLEDVAFDEGDV